MEEPFTVNIFHTKPPLLPWQIYSVIKGKKLPDHPLLSKSITIDKDSDSNALNEFSDNVGELEAKLRPTQRHSTFLEVKRKRFANRRNTDKEIVYRNESIPDKDLKKIYKPAPIISEKLKLLLRESPKTERIKSLSPVLNTKFASTFDNRKLDMTKPQPMLLTSIMKRNHISIKQRELHLSSSLPRQVKLKRSVHFSPSRATESIKTKITRLKHSYQNN
ncbi:unnamed protein product [Blepharisma stoltei]|uniref:Uncharacterized protein n=1 Tax=Blepharisma stoltei TaxID=1481888 RepID=A0AAU9JQS6_9CILI|nr:unnamed protein product [Blepharisma stoltei]